MYSNGPTTTSCSGWSGGLCQCPPNYTNAGLFCAASSISKSSYERGAGTPLVGTVSTVSLGVGVVPFSVGVSSCTTSVSQNW